MEVATFDPKVPWPGLGAVVTRVLIAATWALALHVVSASAQEAYPDFRGTWTGTVEHVLLNLDRSGATFDTGPIKLVVKEQRGRRFVGEIYVRLAEQPLNIELVGIFTSETEFMWSETDGIVNGRMLDDNTFEACFLRVSAYSQVAACETMNRQE